MAFIAHEWLVFIFCFAAVILLKIFLMRYTLNKKLQQYIDPDEMA